MLKEKLEKMKARDRMRLLNFIKALETAKALELQPPAGVQELISPSASEVRLLRVLRAADRGGQ